MKIGERSYARFSGRPDVDLDADLVCTAWVHGDDGHIVNDECAPGGPVAVLPREHLAQLDVEKGKSLLVAKAHFWAMGEGDPHKVYCPCPSGVALYVSNGIPVVYLDDIEIINDTSWPDQPIVEIRGPTRILAGYRFKPKRSQLDVHRIGFYLVGCLVPSTPVPLEEVS